MELLTGFGPPFNSTPGQPGQCYKDLNTGDIYKCCQAIDIHTPHFDQAAEYRWKLHIEGDEQADLAEMDETKRSFVKNKDSIQPDWDQNDPTQPDYIKNRTHFYKDKETVTLMEEQTVSFTNAGDYFCQAISPVYIDLDVDSTYIVKFDDIEYECAVKQQDDGLFIGNGFLGGTEDTHEPFLYGIIGQEQGVWAYFGTEKNHTISVAVSRMGIQKIPKKFIPWDESNFKEPIYISNGPEAWRIEEKENYYNKWCEGHAIIINYNGSATFGIVIGMYYEKTVGLQMCIISSTGELWCWQQHNSSWSRSNITEDGIRMTVDNIIDNTYSWPIFSEQHINNVNIGDTIHAQFTWNKNDKKPAIFKRSKTNISGVVNETYTNLVLNEDKEIILTSSTEGSSKKFALTVDDSGTISATEVTA